jgi:hypothetical protein
MADANGDTSTTDANANTDANTGDTGATGNQSNTGDQNAFDINKLDKSAWEQIFQHDRFKQLNEKAKTADQLVKEKKEAEETALKEQGKWKDLASKREQDVERWKQSSISAEIKAIAAKHGAVDLDAVALLADKAGVTIDDSGNITGADDVVKALLESKPYLFNTSNTPKKVGTGTNPGDPANQGPPKFTHSQIKDPAFWKEHEKEILSALRAGQVVDDLAK